MSAQKSAKSITGRAGAIAPFHLSKSLLRQLDDFIKIAGILRLLTKHCKKLQSLGCGRIGIVTLQLAQSKEAPVLIAEFFQASAGNWRSERRYYTLPDGETKEMVSLITIEFLAQGCEKLQKLAQLHQLSNLGSLTCGAQVTWNSTDSVSGKKQSKGSTLFGVLGRVLYRDRGFATPKPVKADYYFINDQTMCLRTEYNGSVFEEELKLVGSNYRTRQTIISRAGEQQMIGQYLEKRIG